MDWVERSEEEDKRGEAERKEEMDRSKERVEDISNLGFNQMISRIVNKRNSANEHWECVSDFFKIQARGKR